MHILFVTYHHLDSNSGIHIYNLANQLSHLGVTCTVCVPDHKETVKALGDANFEVQNFDNLRKSLVLKRVDLIHAWTPRERVRLMVEQLVNTVKLPYLVHLEDNEEYLLQSNMNMSADEILAMPKSRLNTLIPEHLSHPIKYKQFLVESCGVTMVINTLQDFVPKNKPSQVIWAGYEEAIRWQVTGDIPLRKKLNIPSEDFVVAYTGNVHASNYIEVFSLYLAVGILNRIGVRTRLIRTGTDFVTLYDKNLSILDQYCISLGRVTRSELPDILATADVLVQPGKDDFFNSYRFPSKLPEYLASGKPVLLPATNIGNFLKDNEQAILLYKGNALEIAQKLKMLFADHNRRKRIGDAGKKFAEDNLKWSDGARKLFYFYQEILSSL